MAEASAEGSVLPTRTIVNVSSSQRPRRGFTSTVTVSYSYARYTGNEAARHNLELEIPAADSFDAVEARAQQQWDKKLGVIEVEGATDDQLTTLYSNLYRLNLYPNSAFENTGTPASPVYKHAVQSSSSFDIPDGTTTTETGAPVVPRKVYVNNGF